MKWEEVYKKIDGVLTKTPVIGPDWKTTLGGYAVAGAIAAWDFIGTHDYHDPKFWAGVGAAAFIAIKGHFEADAKEKIKNVK